MTEAIDIKDARKWVQCWAKASRSLKEIRSQEIRSADTAAALRSFEGMLPRILESHPPLPWSGLIEQQRLFSKLRYE